MASAIVRTLTSESPLGEIARFAIVTACPLALILAGLFKPL